MPLSSFTRDKAVRAQRGVKRHLMIYCLKINCLLLTHPTFPAYGNSLTAPVIDGEKVALINGFVCQESLFFSSMFFLSSMINNNAMASLISKRMFIKKKCKKVLQFKTNSEMNHYICCMIVVCFYNGVQVNTLVFF